VAGLTLIPWTTAPSPLATSMVTSHQTERHSPSVLGQTSEESPRQREVGTDHRTQNAGPDNTRIETAQCSLVWSVNQEIEATTESWSVAHSPSLASFPLSRHFTSCHLTGDIAMEVSGPKLRSAYYKALCSSFNFLFSIIPGLRDNNSDLSRSNSLQLQHSSSWSLYIGL